jgi:hypothetical protein
MAVVILVGVVDRRIGNEGTNLGSGLMNDCAVKGCNDGKDIV